MKPARNSLKMNLTGAKEEGMNIKKKGYQLCQKNHGLDTCFKYQKLQVDKIKRLLMESKLCFGFYNVISKKHIGSNCPKGRKYSICKDKYPIDLHSLQPRKGHSKKKMKTILLQYYQDMRKRKIL